MTELDRVLVDTCVVIDLLVDDTVEDRANRAGFLLDGHGEKHEVVLPAIVMAEIAGCPSLRDEELDADERARRLSEARTWLSAAGFVLAEVSASLAKRSADIAFEHMLKGPDAMVLATALAFGCKTLFTRDQQLIQRGEGALGIQIEEPPQLPEPTTLFPA